MRGPWVSNTQGPRIDREEMIKMAALGLLLMILVATAIVVVYIAGLVWLARHEVREDESPPPEIFSPNLPNQRSRTRQATSAR
jgi:hypothetical protein